MMNCPKCKAEIEHDSWFCDQCGQEIRFCVSCGKTGKGKRCTFCGGITFSAKESTKENSSATAPGKNVQSIPAEDTKEPVYVRKAPRLILSSKLLNIQIEAEEGAIIGRKKGPYISVFCTQPYVSGTHAKLHYDEASGWMITDLGSSNGTRLGNTKLEPNVPYIITNGIQVRIANIEFLAELA